MHAKPVGDVCLKFGACKHRISAGCSSAVNLHFAGEMLRNMLRRINTQSCTPSLLFWLCL